MKVGSIVQNIGHKKRGVHLLGVVVGSVDVLKIARVQWVHSSMEFEAPLMYRWDVLETISEAE